MFLFYVRKEILLIGYSYSVLGVLVCKNCVVVWVKWVNIVGNFGVKRFMKLGNL